MEGHNLLCRLQTLGSTFYLANGGLLTKIVLLEAIAIALACISPQYWLVKKRPLKTTARGQSYYIVHCILGRHTTSMNMCVPPFLLRYDKVWKENKTRRDTLFPSAAVALMRVARKFKLIFLKPHLNKIITNNPMVWTPLYYAFFKALPTSFTSFTPKTAHLLV